MADNVYNLKFTLSNGDVIDAGQITAPQGPKGDKGDSATIDADTLNGLLSGSNGIAIAKNTAGDKVEVKIGEEFTSTGFIMHGPNGKSTTIKPTQIEVQANDATYQEYIEIDGKKIHHYEITGFNQGAPTVVDSVYLHQDNVKTLFGNQSIYGSGNIDLYKHNVIISQGSTESERMCVYCQILSSNNLNINSLTAFQTIVKDDNEFIPATGKLKLWNGDEGSIIGGVCKSGAIEYNIRGKYTNNIDFSSGWATINAAVSGGLTFTDTVTTV